MAKTKNPPKVSVIKRNLLPIVLSVLLLILTGFAYQQFMANKYHPLTYVGDTNISFLTRGQAIQAIESSFQKRARQKLDFSLPDASGLRTDFTIDLTTSSAVLDYSKLDESFQNSHNGSIVFFSTTKISPEISLSLEGQLDNLASVVDKPSQNAKLIFDETPTLESTPSSRIQVTPSVLGFSLDKDGIKKQITDYLLSGRYQDTVPLKKVQPKVTTAHIEKARKVLEKSSNNPIKLVFGNQTWFIDTKQLLALLDLETGQNTLLNKEKTDIYLASIASEIDRNVVEGLFEFNPATKKVAAFKPSQEGRKLDTAATYKMLNNTLASQGDAWEPVVLPVEIIKPKIQTNDVNSLGIKELLSRGISNFAGSIPNRIYNINLTASKINGVLVPPGQIFSFNQTVGDINAETGFKQAYVIKEGRTVLDDGGGVCQDSTTLFRAVLLAGLPVIKRTAHAYRVGYYEQGFPPGLDATVFAPSVDFQFQNDTLAHILIQAYTSGTTLYIDLYGTSDGRVAGLTRPVVTNQTPPPPDLRQDDPTLPKGTIKQVDWSAWGATVTFNRTVVRQGETLINETWKSFYKPWQAVYLVGTQ